MQLILLYGNEVIDTISIDREKLSLPGYIISLQEELIERNEESLALHPDAPHFALENVPSRMNYKSPFALQEMP